MTGAHVGDSAPEVSPQPGTAPGASTAHLAPPPICLVTQDPTLISLSAFAERAAVPARGGSAGTRCICRSGCCWWPVLLLSLLVPADAAVVSVLTRPWSTAADVLLFATAVSACAVLVRRPTSVRVTGRRRPPGLSDRPPRGRDYADPGTTTRGGTRT